MKLHYACSLISDCITIAFSYTIVIKRCLQFSNGCCYCVLHAVTGSVCCILCPSITEKLLSNTPKSFIPSTIIAMCSPGMGTDVLEFILLFTLDIILLQLYVCYRSLHQLITCIVIVLLRFFYLTLVL